jgi:hypothetical protein
VLLGILELAGTIEDGIEAIHALDAVGPEAHAAFGHHADARGGHAGQPGDVVAHVVLGHESDLEAATVLVDVVHEGLGEVRRHVARHAVLLGGLGLQRVHDIRDVDLLGAADGAQVAGDAHPGRVAVHDAVARPGANQGRSAEACGPCPVLRAGLHTCRTGCTFQPESPMAARPFRKVGARVPPTGAEVAD